MTAYHPPLAARCQISGCTSPAVVYAGMSAWGSTGGSFCGRHKPTAEQALRRGLVADDWKVHGYYPNEIAEHLTNLTGHRIRESTVRADLKWLGLTERDRAAEARLALAVDLGEAGPNVVPITARRKQA
jgi:hypothetical protein